MYVVTDSVLSYLRFRYMLICYILVITKFSVLLVNAENTKELFFFLPKWHRLRARRNIRVQKKRVTKVRRTTPPHTPGTIFYPSSGRAGAVGAMQEWGDIIGMLLFIYTVSTSSSSSLPFLFLYNHKRLKDNVLYFLYISPTLLSPVTEEGSCCHLLFPAVARRRRH